MSYMVTFRDKDEPGKFHKQLVDTDHVIRVIQELPENAGDIVSVVETMRSTVKYTVSFEVSEYAEVDIANGVDVNDTHENERRRYLQWKRYLNDLKLDKSIGLSEPRIN